MTAHQDLAQMQPPVLRAPARSGSRDVITARVARVHPPGDPLVYPWGSELRDETEVRRIVAQLNSAAPVVALHPNPDDHDGLIRAGARARIIGAVRYAWYEDGYAMAELAITDRAIIDAGVREISLGYESRLDPHGYQRDVAVDHVAIVPRGRCGPTCELRADVHEHLGIDHAEPPQNRRRLQMDRGSVLGSCGCPGTSTPCTCPGPRYTPTRNATGPETISQIGEAQMADTTTDAETVRNLGAQLATAEKARTDAAALAASEKTRADTAEGKIIEMEKIISGLKAKGDEAQHATDTEVLKREVARADAAEKTIKEFDKTFAAAVQARVALERQAEIVMGPTFKMDKLTDREVICSVVKHLDPKADVGNGVADGVILGRFQAVTEARAEGARAQARVAQITATQTERVDSRPATKPKWMRPLPNARKGA